MNLQNLAAKKAAGEPITMLTCYDYTFARLFNDTDLDMLLVGDSAAMTMHGYDSTVPATLDMVVAHCRAVVRGAPDKFIIGDLPFLSYRSELQASMQAVMALMQTGVQAVKLEGADEHNLTLIRHIVDSGVPVMGHIGLTPQAVHQLGGYKVQGREAAAQQALLQQAKRLADAGCFAVVLECVPASLAAKITRTIPILTIGIGAGEQCDGQVLVMQDLLGLNQDFKPKFVKPYLDGKRLVQVAVNDYIAEVAQRQFPDHDHCFH